MSGWLDSEIEAIKEKGFLAKEVRFKNFLIMEISLKIGVSVMN